MYVSGIIWRGLVRILPTMQRDALLIAINARHGTRLSLSDAYPEGECCRNHCVEKCGEIEMSQALAMDESSPRDDGRHEHAD